MNVRKSALECLTSRSWIANYGVSIEDTTAALADENSFDALLTTAGLLRVLLDDEQLSSPRFEDSVAEGGILGTGTINFDLPQTGFSLAAGNETYPDEIKTARASILYAVTTVAVTVPRIRKKDSLESTYLSPIPKCTKRFIGGRGGWDGHAGSLKNHPDWHPAVSCQKDRVQLFRVEFPWFFS